jgi:hypothetical protein
VPAGFTFLVEIASLEGRARLEGAVPVHSVIVYGKDGRATVRE